MEKGEAQATAVSEVPMRDQEKQGGKCCGGCCDYRRAVIILSIISLVFSIISLLGTFDPTFDESEYPDLTKIVEDHALNILIVQIVGIVMTVTGLVGAVIFNFYMVALYVLWSILALIVGIILQKQTLDEMLDWVEKEDGGGSDPQLASLETTLNTALISTYAGAAILTALWVYPSIFLAVEIKKGIMTKATYPREETSCCCLAK